MKLDSRTGFAVLIISGMIIIPFTVIINETKTEPFNMEIQENTAFDPVCLRTERENTTDVTCQNQSDWWFVEQGLSTSFEFGDETYNSKSLLAKIDLSKIPTSDLWTQITITKSDLTIGALYQAINMTEEPNERFIVTYGLCDDVNWNDETKQTKLSCFDDVGRPILRADLFQGILKPERINTLNFDIKSHGDEIRNKNTQAFTEVITFSTGSFLENNDYKTAVQTCLKNTTTESNKNDCIKHHQIMVYGSKFPSSGFKPKIFGEYKKEPTVLSQSISNVVFAAYPIIASFLIYVRNQENDFKRKMQRICSSLTKEIEDTLEGLRNGVGNTKPSETFKVEYDENYEPIELKVTPAVSNLILFTDAYRGIISSGSFEYFTKDDQIEISTLYNYVLEHNRLWDEFFQTIEKTRLQTISNSTDADKIYWGLQKNLGNKLYLISGITQKIIQKISEPEKGVLKRLNDEYNRFNSGTRFNI